MRARTIVGLLGLTFSLACSDRPVPEADVDGAGATQGQLLCTPASERCVDTTHIERCSDDGSAWSGALPCPAGALCLDDQCSSTCELFAADPSTYGCSFFVTRMNNFRDEFLDSLIVGNMSGVSDAEVQVFYVAEGSDQEAPLSEPITLAPGGLYSFILDAPPMETTRLRHGGVYRVASNAPLAAYLHSPLEAEMTNDASTLLPEHALTGNYVIASSPDNIKNEELPSYFTAIAIADQTTLEVRVSAATEAGDGLPALIPGETLFVELDRYDTLNIVALDGEDLSGTLLRADKPLWVVGATECANIPSDANAYCDHLEEASIPLEYWGTSYVCPHAPTRGGESYHWRVFGGAAAVTIDASPPQPGLPITLGLGEYHTFATGESFVLTGDGPFLPVQYLEGEQPSAWIGDPSMVQMVPTAQYLTSYAFVTGLGYDVHYAQVIRSAGGGDVVIDGEVVSGYYPLGGYEVADWKVSEGSHFASSSGAFSIVQIGYTEVTSYAYPVGMRLAKINPI